MKKILVFVNFIETSKLAVEQAVVFGGIYGSEITVCHISDGKIGKEELEAKLKLYLNLVDKAGLSSKLILDEGAFFNSAEKVAMGLMPDLVIMGTRGAEGYDMKLRGSAIYKLVSELPFSSLVFSNHSRVAHEGFKKIMLPISPHPLFLKKVRESRKVLAKDGEMVVFSIKKDGITVDEDTQKNLSDTVQYLKENNVKYSVLEHYRENRGHGYAGITLQKMKEEGMDLVSIISNVSERNKHFGKMEKEDVLLNEEGIPVFCVNTAVDD